MSSLHNDLATWAARARVRGHDTITISVDVAEKASELIVSQATEQESLAGRLLNYEDEGSELLFPRKLTDDLREILSMMMWNTGPIAHVLRAGGEDIKTQAEDEQAHVLHWLICLALENGSQWRAKAADRITEIRANLSASQPSGSQAD